MVRVLYLIVGVLVGLAIASYSFSEKDIMEDMFIIAKNSFITGCYDKSLTCEQGAEKYEADLRNALGSR